MGLVIRYTALRIFEEVNSNVNIASRGDSRERAAMAQLVVLFDFSFDFYLEGRFRRIMREKEDSPRDCDHPE